MRTTLLERAARPWVGRVNLKKKKKENYWKMCDVPNAAKKKVGKEARKAVRNSTKGRKGKEIEIDFRRLKKNKWINGYQRGNTKRENHDERRIVIVVIVIKLEDIVSGRGQGPRTEREYLKLAKPWVESLAWVRPLQTKQTSLTLFPSPWDRPPSSVC